MVPLTLAEHGALAKARLPAVIWDFFDGAAGSEWTARANRDAWQRHLLRPRVLVDVSAPDCRTELFGDRLAAPYGVAPMAYHGLAHPDAECATARAAAAAGALLVASIFAGRTLEQIAEAAPDGTRWLQLYWLRDREALAALVARAEAAGYRALVLTVDAPKVGRRLRDLRNAFALPPGMTAANLAARLTSGAGRAEAGRSGIEEHSRQQFDPTVTWADLAWLRRRTTLPLLLKGVLTAEDARLAVEHGVDGLVVSNHGGRQLDGTPPAPDALAEVVAAVPADLPVLVDGGLRHGADLARALALGARAALIGRPVLWGLAHGGADGARAVLDLLREELLDTMVLAGRPTLADLDRGALAPRPGAAPTHR
ncbi:alpha-hydroxy acid oxidase [Kitasatospora sp. YST-16]|uniref:alpha-hydroxy acid oxidase n=1 Tax=unclassified Kitasatospora TaxID=2633591 RepID=UPI0004C31D3D|nr:MULTISPECIES: alpha-hydroxy acid oxidase [unclassified Kitasatospora]WAL75394.1 alpha-hydroxy acid oxidase [Kitasatospora sp. YST-16]WNW41454.1 alpha-hydroxy acid oxidase [Streptomyces sp. Li-HN-5-13]